MTEQMTELLIDPQEVDEAFLDCLYREEELKEANVVPDGAKIVEGVLGNKFGFHPGRLEEKRKKVIEWLRALPR